MSAKPDALHLSRQKKLFALFGRADIDALFVSSGPNVTYLSGFRNDESWIIVSPKGLFFITDSRYSEQAEQILLPDTQVRARPTLPKGLEAWRGVRRNWGGRFQILVTAALACMTYLLIGQIGN